MENYTVQVEDFLNHYVIKERIEERLNQVAEQYGLVWGWGKNWFDDVEGYELVGDEIEIATVKRSRCNCCPDDYSFIRVPLKAIETNDWIEEEREIRAAQEQKKMEEKEAEEAEFARREAEARRELYLELRDEFEDGEE